MTHTGKIVLATFIAAMPAAYASGIKRSNLVSDGFVAAAHIDPNLVNPWGLSFSPGGPFWISDNGTGVSTLYDGSGNTQPLVVTIPKPGGGTSAPSGQVFNGTGAFSVTEGANSGSALFIFVSEDGTISGWNPGVDANNAVIAVDNSASGAVYKGCALYTDKAGDTYLLVANFHAGFVEVYDSTFKFVRRFRDRGNSAATSIPFDYAPFNVAVLNSKIFVSYAKVKPGRHDDEAGPGHGYLDQMTIHGQLTKRVDSQGPLNSPWGMAMAPPSFGAYAGTLLVGNFGNGHINAFDVATGAYKGLLPALSGKPVEIQGLWGITPGNNGSAGSADDLYFTAGPDGEAHGLFGSLSWEP